MAVKRYKGKKSLKEPDEFLTFSSRLLNLIILHKNKVISALGGIVVLGLIMSGITYFSRKAEASAFLRLNQAVAQYEAAQKEAEGTPLKAYDAVKNTLEEIADRYGNKMGGKLASFYLADCCFAAGLFDQAEALYRKAVKDFKGEIPFEILAKSSLGYSLEQQGKHKEAAAVFSEIPSDTGSIMGDESLLALSRQYESMGNVDLQLESAKKLIETYPRSIYINLLREKYPDLVQPES